MEVRSVGVRCSLPDAGVENRTPNRLEKVDQKKVEASVRRVKRRSAKPKDDTPSKTKKTLRAPGEKTGDE